MADIEKVIKAIERCLACNPSPIASAEANKAYLDCEYTVGLYCGQDKLLYHVIEALKEQKLVRCKDCEHIYFASNRVPDERSYACGKHGIDIVPEWFCADGERRDTE